MAERPTKLTNNWVVVNDRDLAAWFLANGLAMQGSGLAANGKFVEFYFEKSEQVDQLKKSFQVGANVNVQVFLSALDQVWSVIKQQRDAA